MRYGIRVVEIGSWNGCSTSVIANCINDRGGWVLTIDTFEGSQGTWNIEEAKAKSLVAVQCPKPAAP